MGTFKDEVNKKICWLINKLGTIVEDIFFPSFDTLIEKTFNIKFTKLMTRLRKPNVMEIDILGIHDPTKRVFIVEVKATPDRINYIDIFEDRLKMFKNIFEEYRNYDVIGIYAGMSMEKKTIDELSKRGMYALVVKGDILEIVNKNIEPKIY